jgi:hypothetical protein
MLSGKFVSACQIDHGILPWSVHVHFIIQRFYVQFYSVLSLMGVFDLIGTTLSGWLSDRFDNRWLLFWYYSLRGASLLFLPFALSEGSITLLIIFSVFYGLDWIATVPPTVNISRQIFGIEKRMKKLGTVGGIGPEATVDYYQSIISKFQEEIGSKVDLPELFINSINMYKMFNMLTNGETQEVINYLTAAVQKLESVGALCK